MAVEHRVAGRLRARLARFGVHGDYLSRLQSWVAGRCPFFVELILLAGYSALFFVLCGAARRAIVFNLGVILPGSTRWANWWRAYRVIWNFSESLTEASRVRAGEKVIEWEVEGDDHLEELRKSGAGAILLTAHMGNYDIAGRMFADAFFRRIHAVRAPERQPDVQELRRRELEGQSAPANLVVRYNQRNGMLGVDLARAIEDGEVVAIQGDRILFDVAAIEARFDEAFALRVPKGPFVLGAVTGCPIYPVFFVSSGYRRYRVIAGPPFACERRRGAGQQECLALAADRWLAALRPVMRRFWNQWYVFEPAFVRR